MPEPKTPTNTGADAPKPKLKTYKALTPINNGGEKVVAIGEKLKLDDFSAEPLLEGNAIELVGGGTADE